MTRSNLNNKLTQNKNNLSYQKSRISPSHTHTQTCRLQKLIFYLDIGVSRNGKSSFDR